MKLSLLCIGTQRSGTSALGSEDDEPLTDDEDL
jgi:hypothetical protein